jgi:mRNA interferase RelE/StbE
LGWISEKELCCLAVLSFFFSSATSHKARTRKQGQITIGTLLRRIIVPVPNHKGEGRPAKIWRIEITRTATRQITKLDRQAQKSIQKFLRGRLSAADNPRQWGRALQGEKRGLWRYRVGDCRLICDIQDERITILVLELGHCKDAYR